MRVVLLLALLFPLLACGTSDKKVRAQDRKDKYGRYPEVAERYKKAVEQKKLLRGMVKSEVRAVMEGGPDRKREERRGGQNYTVWVYAKRSLDIWFDDEGYLMKWEGPY